MTTTYSATHRARCRSRRIVSWRQSNRRRHRKPIALSDGHSAIVIATTPSVVPAASTRRSVVDTSASVIGPLPCIAMNTSIVAITAMLLSTGANICAANRRFAVRIPAATAPTP